MRRTRSTDVHLICLISWSLIVRSFIITYSYVEKLKLNFVRHLTIELFWKSISTFISKTFINIQ